ncbi:MAG: hypothetical protein JW881_06060 [Spirochaetales bacterium]|nr:hypothetical protein [Spirochaetales bacterium]
MPLTEIDFHNTIISGLYGKNRLTETYMPYSLEKITKINEVNRRIKAEETFSENEMNLSEARILGHLRARDAEVRAHEHAHIAAAGGIATAGASYSFVMGPDGRLYAVGGEVSIDTSPVPGNPEETIRKAQKIRRAALAPANPSPQDMRVAAAAIQMEQQARAELRQEKAVEAEEKAEAAGNMGAHENSVMGYAGDRSFLSGLRRVEPGEVSETFFDRLKDYYDEQVSKTFGEPARLVDVYA